MIEYIVYMHINKINNKKYIGITSKSDPNERFGSNGICYKPNKHFYAAIKKYGWNNFDHIILFSGLSHDEACDKEIKLIKEYNTTDDNYGYNNSPGGDGHSFRHSDKSKRKMSEAMSGASNPNYQGKYNTPEQMRKLREANLGSKHTEEHKKKIGDALRGRIHHTQKTKDEMSIKFSKPIVRSDGKIYKSLTEAAIDNNVNHSAISRALKNNTNSAGYKWTYAQKPND